MDKTTIIAQPFSILLIETMHTVSSKDNNNIPKGEKEFKEWRNGARSRIGYGGRYVVDIFKRFSNLTKVFDRIQYSQYLISRSSKGYITKSNQHGRIDWTDYHFYVYTTSMASIYDCSLLLVAEVYELGLHPRFCTYDIISQHKLLRGTPVIKLLNKLYTTMNPHISRRNCFLHQGEESGFVDLVDEDNYQMIESNIFLEEHGYPLMPSHILSILWKHQLKKIKHQLLSFATMADKSVVPILTELYPIMKAKFIVYDVIKK